MKSKLIILGCGSSVGVPRIDGCLGKCNKNEKKTEELDVPLLLLEDLIQS